MVERTAFQLRLCSNLTYLSTSAPNLASYVEYLPEPLEFHLPKLQLLQIHSLTLQNFLATIIAGFRPLSGLSIVNAHHYAEAS